MFQYSKSELPASLADANLGAACIVRDNGDCPGTASSRNRQLKCGFGTILGSESLACQTGLAIASKLLSVSSLGE